jgi:hypothetical protein
MGEHLFTLDEYKNLKRSLNELDSLMDEVRGYKREITQPYYQPSYIGDMEDWKNSLKKLEGDWAKWKGEDADSYRATAEDIIHDIESFHEEYVKILDRMLRGMQYQYDSLEESIQKCENGQMTLGGNIVVQGASLLGIEVE